jgi:tRNA pseudouridine38-40 synthase
MVRFRLRIAYDGSAFHGWQVQAEGRTVQGELEGALGAILGGPVRVHGSGRTDSGVHALGQTAHFDAPGEASAIPWVRALNANLPPDVRVLAAGAVPETFHARYSATGKTYAYTLWPCSAPLPPQRRMFVWACGPLDLERMDRAAASLLGEHDFAAFQNAGTEVESTVREVTSCARSAGAFAGEVVWRFSATGFLKQMVRNMVGCLAAVGRGKLAPEDVPALLERGDRTLAPATAPAHGLALERVDYADFPDFPE